MGPVVLLNGAHIMFIWDSILDHFYRSQHFYHLGYCAERNIFHQVLVRSWKFSLMLCGKCAEHYTTASCGWKNLILFWILNINALLWYWIFQMRISRCLCKFEATGDMGLAIQFQMKPFEYYSSTKVLACPHSNSQYHCWLERSILSYYLL